MHTAKSQNSKLRDAYSSKMMVCTIPKSTWIDWQGWKASSWGVFEKATFARLAGTELSSCPINAPSAQHSMALAIAPSASTSASRQLAIYMHAYNSFLLQGKCCGHLQGSPACLTSDVHGCVRACGLRFAALEERGANVPQLLSIASQMMGVLVLSLDSPYISCTVTPAALHC
jgi:hypothetical protein